jgi:chromate transporter
MSDVTSHSASSRGISSHAHGVSIAEAFWVWARIAALSFGGPAGQIAVMHRIVVDEKKWIGEHRFLHALSYCTLLPGPEAQQLAIYIGWLMHRTMGGLMAGILFVLPGFLSILALSYIYMIFGSVSIVSGLFFGLKAAVLAVVVQAVFRIGGRALRNNLMVTIAAAALVAIFFFEVPFPIIVFVAGIIGFLGGRSGSALFETGGGHKAGSGPVLSDADSLLGEMTPPHARPDLAWSLKISAVLITLWAIPVGGLYVVLGPDDVFTQISVFFSKMAVVTFGGAYAVLSYVAQQAVEHYHWLKPGEMLDGLGMAETTPGPLIQVVQFVGFMGAFKQSGWACAADRSDFRLRADDVGDVRSLLPLDFPRRPLRRETARQCGVKRGSLLHHRRYRRRDPQPRRMVRPAHAVFDRQDANCRAICPGYPRVVVCLDPIARTIDRGGGGDVSLQSFGDHHASGMRRDRRHLEGRGGMKLCDRAGQRTCSNLRRRAGAA